MRPTFFRTAIPPFFACGPSQAVSGGFLRVGEVRRNEVRNAVAAHRAAQREEVQREEAPPGAGSPRPNWPSCASRCVAAMDPAFATGHSGSSAESQPAERIVPAPRAVELADSLTAPRSQRR
jgi:hypothetical protein